MPEEIELDKEEEAALERAWERLEQEGDEPEPPATEPEGK